MALEAIPATPSSPIGVPRPTPTRRRRAVAEHELRYRSDGALSRAVSHAVPAVLCVLTAFPIVWMYLAAFRGPSEIFRGVIPLHPTLENFRTAFDSLPFWHLLANTIAMAVGVSLGQLLTGLLAAYAFACWRFRGQNVLLVLVVATWLVPFQVTMIPNYVLVSKLGLLNTVGGVIVPQVASAFAVLLLRQHFKSFPKELLEASRIDGQSSWSTLWKVVVPNLAPTLAALEILLFVSAWNEYFWPLIVFRTPDSVLQTGIGNFMSDVSLNYGALLAASGLATLPILGLYLVLQRRLVNAFVRSGLR
jgi:sn-glycerol 3-phosphate transport system permease protein